MPTQLRYDRWFLPLLAPLGMGPKHSDVRVDGGNLHIRMGWGFSATIPLSSIKKAEPSPERFWSAGVHGRRGRWLVNGSAKGTVELTIDPPVPAHAVGRSIELGTLWVSVTDPDALIAALAPASPTS